MASASILPCAVVSNVASFYVQLVDLALFTSATFKVISLDASGLALKTDILTMSTDEYHQWNSDDTFVFRFVAQKLGYTLDLPAASPPTQPVVVPPPVSNAEPSSVFTIPPIILT
jgi:hypothetical protein